jgi:two-component system sensor histidine kinase KdpD
MVQMSNPKARPPPALLPDATGGKPPGRLKIFLGAAPGVGKTYQMLLAAQERRREGTDVVIGVIETHRRSDTEAQLAGIEVLPRRVVEYKGHRLEEMDIDAILRRCPSRRDRRARA